MMAGDSATALDIGDDGHMLPARWDDWLKLPVRERDHSIGTARGLIRVPTVIVLARFAQGAEATSAFLPAQRVGSAMAVCVDTRAASSSLAKAISITSCRARVVATRRGKTACWRIGQINSRKADRTPDEAGLKLLRAPKAPKELPTNLFICNAHEVADWAMFIE